MADVLSTDEIARLRRYCTLVESERLCDSHETLRSDRDEAIRMGRHLVDYIDSLDHRECHVVATKARTRYDELEAGT